MRNGTYCFLPGNCFPKETAGRGLLGKLQSYLKRFGRGYYLLLQILGPVISSSAFRKTARKCLGQYGAHDSIIVNIGSGPRHFKGRKDIINVDVFAFAEVDIVADAGNLPIEDQSVDLVINVAMLEHVVDPGGIVREMRRILKPDGKILAYAPFIVPYHAAPHDFHRWTEHGVARLFSQFEHVDIAVGCGPTSGLLYVLEEWLAIFFSLGCKPAHDVLFLTFMIILSPFKYLDFFLEKLSCASIIASGFMVVAGNAGSRVKSEGQAK